MSVPLPFRVPAKASEPTVAVPAKVSTAPEATVTVGLPTNRSAEPSASVPLVTATVPAPALPPRLLLPVEVSAPAPRSAPSTVLPAVNA